MAEPFVVLKLPFRSYTPQRRYLIVTTCERIHFYDGSEAFLSNDQWTVAKRGVHRERSEAVEFVKSTQPLK
jgi:hypothetical protein